MRYRLRRYIALIIFLSVIGVLYFLPFTIPFAFSTSTLIYPAKIWSLRSDLEGNFFGEVKNYHTGVIETSTSYRFERGDINNLLVSEKINQNPVIRSGDTIGRLTSRLIDERIEHLENQLAIDRRLLESSKTGEKNEIIDNLHQKKILAQQQLGLAKINFDRIKALYEEEVVPASEFDTAENEYQKALTNVEIADSDYRVASTGQKPEEISVIEERITSYQREIDFLQTTKKEYLIISPLSGKLVINQLMPTPGEYIAIYDTSEYIIYAPIKYRYRPYLSPDMQVEFSLQNSDVKVEADIFNIADRVDNILGSPVILVKARVVPPAGNIITGMSVNATFIGEPVTLREYIKRTIEIFIL
jgi:hypothetical protein